MRDSKKQKRKLCIRVSKNEKRISRFSDMEINIFKDDSIIVLVFFEAFWWSLGGLRVQILTNFLKFPKSSKKNNINPKNPTKYNNKLGNKTNSAYFFPYRARFGSQTWGLGWTVPIFKSLRRSVQSVGGSLQSTLFLKSEHWTLQITL